MKGTKNVLTVVCVIAVAFSAGFLGYTVTLNRIRAQTPPSPTAVPALMVNRPTTQPKAEITPKPQENTLPQYIIFENEEATIDVFILQYGELTYIRTIDYDCSLLRTEDRVMLQNGIYLNSEEEAAMLIEDFIS